MTARLDELIHQPVRLRLMSALVVLDRRSRFDFGYLRDLLGLTDGNLGAHLRRLEEAGYVRITKTFVGRKPKTYVAASARGRRAFTAHVEALRDVLEGAAEPIGESG